MTIDLKKKYRTAGGQDVELHDIVKRNSAGRRVTFPVKGAVISVSATGRAVRTRCIWTMAGRYLAGKRHDYDLIEVKP